MTDNLSAEQVAGGDGKEVRCEVGAAGGGGRQVESG